MLRQFILSFQCFRMIVIRWFCMLKAFKHTFTASCSHAVINKLQQRAARPIKLSGAVAYLAVMLLFYYSPGAHRNWSDGIFWGWWRLRGCFIISWCMLTLESLMKYLAPLLECLKLSPASTRFFSFIKTQQWGKQELVKACASYLGIYEDSNLSKGTLYLKTKHM